MASEGSESPLESKHEEQPAAKTLAQQLEEYVTDASSVKPEILDEILKGVAATGSTADYEWSSLKKLLQSRLEKVMEDFIQSSTTPPDVDGETYEVRFNRVKTLLSELPRAPFTVQRMCELLTEPKRTYRIASKFFDAFSKLVCGISGRIVEEEEDDDMDLQAPFERAANVIRDLAEEKLLGDDDDDDDFDAYGLGGVATTRAPWASSASTASITSSDLPPIPSVSGSFSSGSSSVTSSDLPPIPTQPNDNHSETANDDNANDLLA